jgi:uncharacterized protein (TIGR03083 family)
MYAEAYRRGHDRVVTFMADRDAEINVPATPDWTAADVVRHLTGLAVDLTSGVVEGYASDPWTARQVAERQEMTLAEVIAEWSEATDAAAEKLDDPEGAGFPERVDSGAGSFSRDVLPAMAISDILHHEFDLRNAYGDTAGRDIMDIHFATAGHVRSIRSLFSANDLETIRIESTDSGMGWDIGYGAPVAVMRAPSFQIMRAIGGRRTKAEIRAMGWEGDPEPYLDSMVIPHLSMRETSLRE